MHLLTTGALKLPILTPMRYMLFALAIVAAGCTTSDLSSDGPSRPNVQGQYSGTYRLNTCSSQTDFPPANGCDGLPSTAPMILTLQQTDASVSGTLNLGTVAIPVSGVVDASGLVTLGGAAVSQALTYRLNQWKSKVSGTSMTGDFTWEVTSQFALATVNSSIQSLTR